MDALEARLQFIQVLKTLPKTLNVNRSVTATGTSPVSSQSSASTVAAASGKNGSTSQEPLQFYLKNYLEHFEDFQQCLMDTMSKMDALDRLHIMIYYSKIIHELYIQSVIHKDDITLSETIQKILFIHVIPSLHRVYELVIPRNEIKGLTNLPYCMEIYKDLQELFQNMNNTVAIDELKIVESYINNMVQAREELYRSYSENLMLQSTLAGTTTPISDDKANEHTQIQIALNRMEMDRDRHKRQKEQNWQVFREHGNNSDMLNSNEFENLWNHIDAFDSTDLQVTKEIKTIATQSYLN